MPMIVVWPPGMPGVKAERGSTTSLVGELRDIFPTFLDVADIEPARQLNGTSIACLLRYARPVDSSACLTHARCRDPTGQSCGWRAYVDLEHDVCYNYTNHWSALTDGSIKCVCLQRSTPFSHRTDTSSMPISQQSSSST